MAVLSAVLELGITGDENRHVEIWNVKVDSMADRPADIIYSGYLPVYGDRVSTNTVGMDLFARQIRAREITRFKWQVTVTYEPSNHPDIEPGEDEELIESRPAELSWDTIEYEQADDFDTEGIDYKNSAGDPFDNAPGRPKSTLVATITQFQFEFNGSFVNGFVGKTNSQLFLGAPADTLRLRRASAVREFIGRRIAAVQGPPIFLWKASYSFEMREDLWQPVDIEDMGARVLVDGEPVMAMDNNGVAHGRIVRLNGAGIELAPDEPSHFIQFRPFDRRNFNLLNIRI